MSHAFEVYEHYSDLLTSQNSQLKTRGLPNLSTLVAATGRAKPFVVHPRTLLSCPHETLIWPTRGTWKRAAVVNQDPPM